MVREQGIQLSAAGMWFVAGQEKRFVFSCFYIFTEGAGVARLVYSVSIDLIIGYVEPSGYN